jgi:acetyltransferase-like isoleucine patch superfamily enzyme
VDIGKNVEIGYFCIIGHVQPHMIHVSDNAVIAARATILEHDNTYYYTVGGDVVASEVYIRTGAFIGVGTIVLPGVTIGPHAAVGALSLVKSNVPSSCLAVGVPARIVKRLEAAVPDGLICVVGLGKRKAELGELSTSGVPSVVCLQKGETDGS